MSQASNTAKTTAKQEPSTARISLALRTCQPDFSTPGQFRFKKNDGSYYVHPSILNNETETRKEHIVPQVSLTYNENHKGKQPDNETHLDHSKSNKDKDLNSRNNSRNKSNSDEDTAFISSTNQDIVLRHSSSSSEDGSITAQMARNPKAITKSKRSSNRQYNNSKTNQSYNYTITSTKESTITENTVIRDTFNKETICTDVDYLIYIEYYNKYYQSTESRFLLIESMVAPQEEFETLISSFNIPRIYIDGRLNLLNQFFKEFDSFRTKANALSRYMNDDLSLSTYVYDILVNEVTNRDSNQETRNESNHSFELLIFLFQDQLIDLNEENQWLSYLFTQIEEGQQLTKVRFSSIIIALGKFFETVKEMKGIVAPRT